MHSSFIELMHLANSNFNEIWIFTNGLIPHEVHEFILSTHNPKLTFVVNLDTRAFQLSLDKRKAIIDKISLYHKFARIYTGFTISELSRNYLTLYENFPNPIIRSMDVRFGIAKPMIGDKPFFNPQSDVQNRQVGQKITETVHGLLKMKVHGITLDCGLMPEMFTDKEQKFIQSNCHIKGWGCRGYWGEFDIDTDLTVLPCFPYSYVQRKKINKFTNFYTLSQTYACKKQCLFATLSKVKTNEIFH